MSDRTDRAEQPGPADLAGIAAALTRAARDHVLWVRGGWNRSPALAARELANAWPAAQYRAVMGIAVDSTVRAAVRTAWTRGWTPLDLYERATRTVRQPAVEYLVDVLAADAAGHGRGTVHQRWQAQLARIGAGVWWTTGTHFDQWMARTGHHRADVLSVVIETLSMLHLLPLLEQILPPPGTATGPQSGAPSGPAGLEEKVLARVRGLLAKAESTEFGEEAETLSAKAQELMSRYALNRAMLDHAPADGNGRAPLATARRLWLEHPYLRPKSSLVGAVAKANRCRALYRSSLGLVTVLGDELDLDIVELLTTSLLVQATRAMVGAGSAVDWRGQSRTRSFRHSFLLAYATRIGERLAGATEAQTSAAAAGEPAQDGGANGGRLLPVLAARERAVDELMASMFPSLRSQTLRVGNNAGWVAGRAAADLATLDAGPAVTSGLT